jgi:hypothetical protein
MAATAQDDLEDQMEEESTYMHIARLEVSRSSSLQCYIHAL